MDIEQAIINALAQRNMTSVQIAREVGCSTNHANDLLRRLRARRQVTLVGTTTRGMAVIREWAIGPEGRPREIPEPVKAPATMPVAVRPVRAPTSGLEAMLMQLGGSR